jgi:hypothetical protein
MLIWPSGFLKPATIQADPVPRPTAASTSMDGRRQYSSSGAPAWIVQYHKIVVLRERGVQTWRAIGALLEGNLSPIAVPLLRIAQPGYETALPVTSHSDGTFFSDGTGYLPSAVEAHLFAGVAAGAATCDINYAYGPKLEPGHTFSISHRAYRVKSVTTAGARQTVTFTPPARENHLPGDRVEIDRPTVRVRLKDPTAMMLDLDPAIVLFPGLTFVEDI